MQSSVGDQVGQARKSSSWQAWVPIALPAFAVIGLIALFFPAATASASGFGLSYSASQSFFDDDAGGAGWWLLILHLAVLGFGVTAIANRAKWARITAGTAGVVVGLIAAFSGFGIIGAASSFGGSSMGISASASPGPGAVILAISSLGTLAAAVLTLLTLRGPSKPELSQND